MDRGFKIPWVSVPYAMGKISDKPWIRGSKYHGYGVKIPWIVGSIYQWEGVEYTMDRGLEIPWISGSKYHG